MLPTNKAYEILISGPNNKEQIFTFVDAIIDGVTQGELNALDVAKQIKVMEETIKQIKTNTSYSESLMTEALKYSEKEVDYHGVKFSVKETGTRYDYKACGYSKYEEALKSKADIEKMLKALSGPMVDPDTGQEINPPAKRSTTAVVFSLK